MKLQVRKSWRVNDGIHGDINSFNAAASVKILNKRSMILTIEAPVKSSGYTHNIIFKITVVAPAYWMLNSQ